ncbi:MAG: hypothetical protein WAV56_00800 [Microgenomates group bacterium]
MNKKQKRNLLVLVLILVASVAIGVITFNLDKIVTAVWQFRNGFIGVPPPR